MLKFNTIPFLKLDKISILYLFIIIFIQIIKQDSILIENYYSTLFYSFSSNISLFIFGWLPFSFGEILILTLPIILWCFLKKDNTRRKNLKIVFQFVALLYILFQFQWGLNYHRTPLDEKLSIKNKFELSSLIKTAKLFVEKTNNVHKKISKSDTLPVKLEYKINKKLFLESLESVKRLKENTNNNNRPTISVKKSFFSTPLSYMGFSGYINPLTLEAQINTNTPKLYLPTTICHEIAHQIGYSAEDEANFIGIMAAISSQNKFISYSGNIQALRYLLNEIYVIDKLKFDALIIEINEGVIKDMEIADNQLKKFKNPFEPYFKGFYDMFLKANNQKQGIRSYNMVVKLLVNYYSNQ